MRKTSKLSRLFKFTWLESGKADLQWDECLNLLMDKAKVVNLNQYHITFEVEPGEEVRVWIENHPYSSGALYPKDTIDITSQPHCKTKTKIRLEDFVNRIGSNQDIRNLTNRLKKA